VASEFLNTMVLSHLPDPAALLVALSGKAAFCCLSTRALQSSLAQDGAVMLSPEASAVVWTPWLQLPQTLANVTIGLMFDRSSGGYFIVRSIGLRNYV
jgi:hypothetical protein